MTKLMSHIDYTTYIKLSDYLKECLIQCAQEISMISRDRKPVGDFIGDLNIEEGDRYLAQFEDWSQCEVDTDSVWVPCQYIYDKEYRKHYRKVLIQEKVDKEVAALEREEQRKLHTYRIVIDDIEDELTTYERLKAKFEGQ